jgi:hypothetical protein
MCFLLEVGLQVWVKPQRLESPSRGNDEGGTTEDREHKRAPDKYYSSYPYTNASGRLREEQDPSFELLAFLFLRW